MRILVAMANAFNVIDLITTIYAVKILGYSELNYAVRHMLSTNLPLYIIFKLSAVIAISIVYILTLNRKEPLFVGINKGCMIGLSIMCIVLGLASFLNLGQIIFGANVAPFLALISKIIPTLR